MVCKNCGNKFTKRNNIAVRINGERITVCPNCGNEEIYKDKKKTK